MRGDDGGNRQLVPPVLGAGQGVETVGVDDDRARLRLARLQIGQDGADEGADVGCLAEAASHQQDVVPLVGNSLEHGVGGLGGQEALLVG